MIDSSREYDRYKIIKFWSKIVNEIVYGVIFIPSKFISPFPLKILAIKQTQMSIWMSLFISSSGNLSISWNYNVVFPIAFVATRVIFQKLVLTLFRASTVAS